MRQWIGIALMAWPFLLIAGIMIYVAATQLTSEGLVVLGIISAAFASIIAGSALSSDA